MSMTTDERRNRIAEIVHEHPAATVPDKEATRG